MPVATVAVPRDPAGPHRVPALTSTSAAAVSDGAFPVPSLPLHHARSCFGLHQRRPPRRPSSPPPRTDAAAPRPSASDNEVSDLLRGCVDVDFQLELLHRRCRRRRFLLRHHRRHHRQIGILCHRDRSSGDVNPSVAWQCVPLDDADDRFENDDNVDDDDDDEELVNHSRDVAVRHAPSAVMSAFYRPSLDFYKMQVCLFCS